jgi:hypothetical protein
MVSKTDVDVTHDAPVVGSLRLANLPKDGT